MTDRVRVLTVALTQDLRTDDVQVLVQAISLLRGVESVMLGAPVTPNDWATETRVRNAMRDAILFTLKDPR